MLSVVPWPALRLVPAAPAWLVGLYALDEVWVPVIDLCRLIADSPCPEGAASRVALVTRQNGAQSRALGLLAPRMTRVVELEAPIASGVFVPGREFLGPIVLSDSLGVQLLDVDRIIPPEVDALLFGKAPA